ncbi:hypothetical protein GGR16_000925 [Chelatococcus caeni]|uniref:Uncharacterized protein n=1 Tax=Chelatococcus caeni TaxID=1348468 RepID=A0A840BX56_9HYPH|nr:hypothetical protein [Chelatococcus caeni]
MPSGIRSSSPPPAYSLDRNDPAQFRGWSDRPPAYSPPAAQPRGAGTTSADAVWQQRGPVAGGGIHPAGSLRESNV